MISLKRCAPSGAQSGWTSTTNLPVFPLDSVTSTSTLYCSIAAAAATSSKRRRIRAITRFDRYISDLKNRPT